MPCAPALLRPHRRRSLAAAGLFFSCCRSRSVCGMWRDLWEYVQALRRQWVGLLAGPGATLILLIWQVFEKTDVAPWVFWVVAAAGVPTGGLPAGGEGPREGVPPEEGPGWRQG